MSSRATIGSFNSGKKAFHDEKGLQGDALSSVLWNIGVGRERVQHSDRRIVLWADIFGSVSIQRSKNR